MECIAGMRSLSEASAALSSSDVIPSAAPKVTSSTIGTLKCVICKCKVNYGTMKPATEVVENKKLLEGMCERFGGTGIPVFCLQHVDLWKMAERNAKSAHLSLCGKTLIHAAEAFNNRDAHGEALDSEGQWHRL